MTYLGMKFKNYAELHEWCKQGAIRYYITLAQLCEGSTDMVRYEHLWKQEECLVKKYGMTYDEIEELERQAWGA